MKIPLIFLLVFCIITIPSEASISIETPIYFEHAKITILPIQNASNFSQTNSTDIPSNTLIFYINNSIINLSATSNTSIWNISYNNISDVWGFNVSGIADLNISVLMKNSTSNYSLYINDTEYESKETDDIGVVWFNYSISGSTKFEVRATETIIYYSLSGNVIPSGSVVNVTNHGEISGNNYDFGNVFTENETVWVNVTHLNYQTNSTQITFGTENIIHNVSLIDGYIPGIPINLSYVVTNNYVNWTWQAGSGNVTDRYDIYHNATWTNYSTNTYFNVNVGYDTWSNISVYSHNISYLAYRNDTPISGSVMTGSEPTPNLRLSGTVVPAGSTIEVTGQGGLTGGSYDFGQVISAGVSFWVNVSKIGYVSNNTQMTIFEDTVHNVTLNATPGNDSPSIIAWGNDYTNNNSLDIVVEPNSDVVFNFTSNQTLSSCTWAGAIPINPVCNFNYSSATKTFVTGSYIVTVNGSNSNGTTQTVSWNIEVNETVEPTPTPTTTITIPTECVGTVNETINCQLLLDHIDNAGSMGLLGGIIGGMIVIGYLKRKKRIV